MITVRNALPTDFEIIANYWTGNSEEYWKALGVDRSKISTKEEFLNRFAKTYSEVHDLPMVCIICDDGVPVGLHSVTHPIEYESAVMHAHIFSSTNRKKGISYYSYPQAIDLFIKKLNLKKIVFKTPKINIGANKAKLKLGIHCLGETVFDAPILFKPLEANLYEVDCQFVAQLLKKISD